VRIGDGSTRAFGEGFGGFAHGSSPGPDRIIALGAICDHRAPSRGGPRVFSVRAKKGTEAIAVTGWTPLGATTRHLYLLSGRETGLRPQGTPAASKSGYRME
jgi:hypothetical protein